MVPFSQSEAEAFWYAAPHLSKEHQQALAQLRSELQTRGCLAPTVDDDPSLLRFLKARGWSVERAAKMYQAMAEWRKAKGVDEMMRSFRFGERAIVRTMYPHFYHKTDKFGRPVYYELLGQVDVAKVMSVTTRERFLNYHILLAESFRREKLPQCSVCAGRTILGVVVVLDLEGFSLAQFAAAKDFLAEISRLDQDVFPEHLGVMFLINAPLLFRSIWACIKPFLDERTLGKIKVLGSSYQSELVALIPAENLPARFGGESAANEMEDEGPWEGTLFSRAASRAASAEPRELLQLSALCAERVAAGGVGGAPQRPASSAGASEAGSAATTFASALSAQSSRRSSRTSSTGGTAAGVAAPAGLGLLIAQHGGGGGCLDCSPVAGGGGGGCSVACARRSLMEETIREEPSAGSDWPAPAASGGGGDGEEEGLQRCGGEAGGLAAGGEAAMELTAKAKIWASRPSGSFWRLKSKRGVAV